ncbi:MAG: 2-oxoacid:ferredoxin oxidoreductase subunit gamma [Caldimicrobium thiodismutans]|jgi:2-oxoglutarate ferredoxin oxidoreductase subunit gamma|uniref:2-oxoacid:ferredoxin oxidoreductase subunit gamma n=1 Tax=Caldimicrobium thiodismutans TaxID=1653476 RepID=A0A2N7PJ49_9BACT|nr:MAG: 2-oxoacid:ferredoxin oxidoreductase subunit gamma [Caldimicrobium thiodismutans]
MRLEVILSGFGGQGILFAGNLLALCGMYQRYQVTFLPVYGPEMRGGTCHCTVILSDKEIASPLVLEPGYLILLNLPSFIKFMPRLKKGGLALVNSDLVKKEEITNFEELIKGKRVIFLPMNTLAEEVGAPQALNMCALGAFNGCLEIFSESTFKKALKEMLFPSKAHLFESNLKAYQRGFQEVKKIVKD